MRLSNTRGALTSRVSCSQVLEGTQHAPSHSEVMGRERECGPGPLPLLGSRVGTWGFMGSLFIGQFKA